MDMKLIQVVGSFSPAEEARLRAAAGETEIRFCSDAEVTAGTLKDADALIGNPPLAMVESAENLKWMQLLSSGADAYAGSKVLKDRGLVLTTATGAYGVGIAEYMVAMLLAMMKKLPGYYDLQKAAQWRDLGAVVSPRGKRVLVVGTGNLGREFARRMRAFECELIGVRRRAGACPPEFDRVCPLSDLESELPEADVVALCLPGTPETHHLFDQAMLSKCKEGAYFMNVGRGTVIPLEALLDRTVTDRFTALWVDVLETEPLPDGHPLYAVPNLLITPHITGGLHLDITRENILSICEENLRAWKAGEPLRSVLDWSTGYCK